MRFVSQLSNLREVAISATPRSEVLQQEERKPSLQDLLRWLALITIIQPLIFSCGSLARFQSELAMMMESD